MGHIISTACFVDEKHIDFAKPSIKGTVKANSKLGSDESATAPKLSVYSAVKKDALVAKKLPIF